MAQDTFKEEEETREERVEQQLVGI